MSFNKINALSIILGLFTLNLAYANTAAFENLTSLELKAEKFIKNSHLSSPYPAIVQIKSLNKKLKLKRCNVPILFEFNTLNKRSGSTLIKASCAAPVQWKMQIPAKITLFQDVLLLKNPVLRSQSIDETDVFVKKMSEKHLTRGYYTHINQLKNHEAKRNLKANTVLSPANLKAKQLIKSGQQVTLELNYLGLGVKVTGTALQSAVKGQLIKVRNNSSLKTVEGTVKANGVVQVHL